MWIKIGSHLINDSFVAAVELNTVRPGSEDLDTATVHLGGGGTIRFAGPEAHAILGYFGQSAVDVMSRSEADRAYMEFRRRGGNLARPIWEEHWTRLKEIWARSSPGTPTGRDKQEAMELEKALMI